jgi:hypothetical protein
MTVLVFGLGFSCLLCAFAASEFTPYRHIQWKWPTAPGAHVETKYAVPVYFRLPARPYTILGSMNAKATQLHGDALIQYEARKAKEVGGDAIIVHTEGATSSVNQIPARAIGSSSGDRFATWWGNAFPAFSGASALVIKFK